MSEEPDWPEVFRDVFARPASRAQERVWRTAFGDEYPEGVEPYSYIAAERGEDAAEIRRCEADMATGIDNITRRILVVAQTPP